MFSRFGLTLMVNHACNLRCAYCYTGLKFRRRLPLEIARHVVLRALNSLEKEGRLDLGFFGGEPLLEVDLIAGLMDETSKLVANRKQQVSFHLTTNGTIAHSRALEVMIDPRLQLSISHDGLPVVHDRHRVSPDGSGSSIHTLTTIKRLLDAGKPLRVVMVVRPDTASQLPDGIAYLRELGVTEFVPSLDLWTTWTARDVDRLNAAIARCADLWNQWLPGVAISWFDERAAKLLGIANNNVPRCGFGQGEIAVAPSGRLYPCERLIGEDAPDSAMQIPGHATEGDDFLSTRAFDPKSSEECESCSLQTMCSTNCRCSNYVRTRDVTRPDGLLCLWNAACFRETARVLSQHTIGHPVSFHSGENHGLPLVESR